MFYFDENRDAKVERLQYQAIFGSLVYFVCHLVETDSVPTSLNQNFQCL